MSKKGRTILFIDNSYAFSGMTAAGWRFSWAKLQDVIEEEGELAEVHFFASEHRPPKENQRNFYSMLNHHLGFTLHLGETKQKTVYVPSNTDGKDIPRTIYLDQGLDVALVTWLLKLVINEAFDTAIILSGHGDYCEAVQTVKDQGCSIELIGWRNSVSKALAELADAPILYLDDIQDKIIRDEDNFL